MKENWSRDYFLIKFCTVSFFLRNYMIPMQLNFSTHRMDMVLVMFVITKRKLYSIHTLIAWSLLTLLLSPTAPWRKLPLSPSSPESVTDV